MHHLHSPMGRAGCLNKAVKQVSGHADNIDRQPFDALKCRKAKKKLTHTHKIDEGRRGANR